MTRFFSEVILQDLGGSLEPLDSAESVPEEA
jgi:hypothetical protein